MSLTKWAVLSTIRGLVGLLCRVDDAQLALVPARGPLILVANHINFLEVPLLYTYLQPRPVTGLAKAETWAWDCAATRARGTCPWSSWTAIPKR